MASVRETKVVRKRSKRASKHELKRSACERQKKCRERRRERGQIMEARFFGTKEQIEAIKAYWWSLIAASPRPVTNSKFPPPKVNESVNELPEAIVPQVLDEATPLPESSIVEAPPKAKLPEVAKAKIRDQEADRAFFN